MPAQGATHIRVRYSGLMASKKMLYYRQQIKLIIFYERSCGILYLEKFRLPSDKKEIEFITEETRTCFNTMYPFKIFPDKELERIEFSSVTIFYGSNGSGKTTLLNIIAQRLSAARQSEFNNSPFFSDYVNLCYYEMEKRPIEIRFISSDDVFDFVLDLRNINEGIDNRRDEVSKTFFELNAKLYDSEERHFRGLEDYDRWKEIHDTAKTTLSQYVKKRVGKNINMFSNGETAMKFFIDRIDENALYLLDEPENSLSIQLQLELAEYIFNSARFFGCQFIIATHSPIFLSMKKARIYNLDSIPVRTCNWTELENVRKYYEFFKSHEAEF